ncbi:MAG TPA: glycoside hydrolase family 3 N-terminal domain-containing protein [Bryobacteraceae bacterium]|nr:glycoside hydrolase family 3 N-terminal domain-containing protein [Bryobacteraceae bacterium]
MHLIRTFSAVTILICYLAASTPAKPPKVKINPVAQRWMKAMPLREKVAQLIVMPCYGESVNVRSAQFKHYQHLVRDLKIGGLIVVGHTVNGSVRAAEPYAMAAFLNRMQRLAKVPLLVSADFERGASMRVASTTAWPYNMAFAAARDLEDTRFEGAFTAKEASALGVNWVFAPDADVNNNPDNPIINIRSYGENPDEVAAHVRAYIEGAHSDPKVQVLITAKHFPGHGDTAQDSHMGLARLDAPKERIESVELKPFRAAVAAKVDSIMTAHLAVPALEPENIPATVSSAILTGVLRNELDFQGIIATDAMDMKGLSEMFSTGEAAVRAIEAGADVLLMPLKAEDAINGVVAAVQSGRISKQRLDQSVLRVLSAKARVGLAKRKVVDLDQIAEVIGSPEADERAEAVADHAVTLVRNDGDLFPVRSAENACTLVLSESRSGQQGRRMIDEIHKRSPRMKVTLLDPGMSKADLDAVAQGTASCGAVYVAAFVSVAAYRGDVALAGEYPGLVNTLTSGHAPVAMIALGNPYLIRSFPGVKAYATTFSTTSTSENAAVKAMFGEISLTGRLPVTIPGIAKYGDGIQLPAIKSSTPSQKGF